MVVDQSVEGIHAARAFSIEKGEASRCCYCHAIAVGSDVSNVIGDQPVGVMQHLLLPSEGIKEHQAVGGGHGSHARCQIGNGAVDAKEFITLKIAYLVRLDKIKTLIKVTNPD